MQQLNDFHRQLRKPVEKVAIRRGRRNADDAVTEIRSSVGEGHNISKMLIVSLVAHAAFGRGDALRGLETARETTRR